MKERVRQFMKKTNKGTSAKISLFILALVVSTLVLGACSDDAKTEEVNDSGEMMVMVKQFDLQSNSLIVDEVEWIEENDKERIKELGLDIEKDLPAGYVVYNETDKAENIQLSEEAEYFLVDYDNLSSPKQVEEKEFVSHVMAVPGPYEVTLKDGKIIKIVEKYIP